MTALIKIIDTMPRHNSAYTGKDEDFTATGAATAIKYPICQPRCGLLLQGKLAEQETAFQGIQDKACARPVIRSVMMTVCNKFF